MSKIRQSQEDYLGVMYKIYEETGNRGIRPIDIVRRLDISKAAVSGMLKTLSSLRLVAVKPYGDASLTKIGLRKARNIVSRHRIIEVFLVNVLKINYKLMHREAHNLEHAFSDEIIRKLSKFLHDPKVCPGGSRIYKIEK